MNLGIYSFAHSSLNDEIAFYQKRVFDKFSIPIKQLVSSDSHPTALEKIIQDAKEDCLLLFDVDCIPLHPSFLDRIIKEVEPLNTLAGAIQCANHKDPKRSYVGPCFCGFSKTLYAACGRPSLSEWERGDVMQKFTDECRYLQRYEQVKVQYWMVTNGGDNCWDLPDDGGKFGHGTIYEGLIYHQFEIRRPEQHLPFIDKCKEVLNG